MEMTTESEDSKLLVLIESVSNLSSVTANHDALLTKLIDDHEHRIRCLEKCSLAIEKFEKDHIAIDKRLRMFENWRWYMIGGFAAIVTAFEIYTRLSR